MYIYTTQAMPGSIAKFDGDTSVKYRIRRTHTASATKDKNRIAVIRTDMGYAEATALVQRFNDKEREARAIRKQAESYLTQNV